MIIQGLNDYGESELAATIAKRWMTKVIAVYDETGKLMEKYNVIDATLVAGGGEYPTQDGFGWTNGVLRKLLALYPAAVALQAPFVWSLHLLCEMFKYFVSDGERRFSLPRSDFAAEC